MSKNMLKTPLKLSKNLVQLLLIISLVFFSQLNLWAKSKTHSKVKNKSVNLASVSATVIDLSSKTLLLNKNPNFVVPIASVTKLMTAMVVLDAVNNSTLSLNERIVFSAEDRKNVNNYFSRIRTSSSLKRGDVIRIALMSSENLAAVSLGRNYPGGMEAFVTAMNRKAKKLGMKKSKFADPAGLSAENVSTSEDLAKMLIAASKYKLIKTYSTTQVFTARFKKPRYNLAYTNTNRLIRVGDKNISLSKTGYLDKSGRCLVMIKRVAGRDLVMIVLDSLGRRSPLADIKRITRWITSGNRGRVSKKSKIYEQMKTELYLF